MKAVLIIFVILILGGIGFVIFTPKNSSEQNITTITSTPIPTNASFAPFTATFEIYTNGTKRIFTDPKYHNLSTKVFLTTDNPNVINVQVSNITWDDFFKTLPMQLSKDCLVTGTKQTFCSNETSKLKFFINDIENPDALDREINPNDHLKVIYNPSS